VTSVRFEPQRESYESNTLRLDHLQHTANLDTVSGFVEYLQLATDSEITVEEISQTDVPIESESVTVVTTVYIQ